ncbi:MAG TPA: hypothetical protein VN881_10985 [Candidatus Acidoferrales bacterium]|nr:hypothetical protein [Candidatus Acidoferrales bacterium]
MRPLIVTIAFLSAAALLFLVLNPPSKQATVPKQPEGWNSNAIRSSFEAVQVKEIDPTHAALIFSFDLQNTTDSDYQLSKDRKVLIMGRLKSNGSFKAEDSMEIDNSVFLPAGSRARMALKVIYAFNWPTPMFPGQVGPLTQEKFRRFVAGKVDDLQGFLLFDEAAHYQIELPGGWRELQPAAVN